MEDQKATSKATRARELTKAHPFMAAVVAGLLGFTVGTGSSGDVESRLASALGTVKQVKAESTTELAALEHERDSLEARNLVLRGENSELTTEVAQLNARRPLPSFVGSAEARAEELGDRFGWDVTVEYRYSDARPGTVLSQHPAKGVQMRYRAPVEIVVAKAIPKLPDVVGSSKARAAKTLRADGYEVAFVEQVSSSKPGTVIATSPGGRQRLIPGETVTVTIAKKAPPAPTAAPASSSAGCTPGYSPCLPPASDYDCAGGSGDGPKYTGYVTVTGSDPYDLDSDGDGVGCES